MSPEELDVRAFAQQHGLHVATERWRGHKLPSLGGGLCKNWRRMRQLISNALGRCQEPMPEEPGIERRNWAYEAIRREVVRDGQWAYEIEKMKRPCK